MRLRIMLVLEEKFCTFREVKRKRGNDDDAMSRGVGEREGGRWVHRGRGEGTGDVISGGSSASGSLSESTSYLPVKHCT